MSNLKTKDLTKIGYHNDQLRSLVIGLTARHFKHYARQELLNLLEQILLDPQAYLDDKRTAGIAMKITGSRCEPVADIYGLRDEPVNIDIYGREGIALPAIQQMELACRLPVSVAGALMPDAHMGFGLPIGGVLATDDAVIPYAVGLDIGCRMSLSIVDESCSFLKRYETQVRRSLLDHTHFGMDGGLETRQEHEILESPLFDELPFLKPLRGKASRQLGTSGSGNHFVEFGELELFAGNIHGLPARKYIALLTHSGSRGLGSAIANRYTRLAMEICKLPAPVQNLAWLDMKSEAGQEYWLAMTLAGDYARACHERIHINLLTALGLNALTTVENHHNFAWKEKLECGREVIVHRKGATPAHKGEPGIIPGSMNTPGYLVTGKGCWNALNSASHGAGRAMSRQQAKESMTVSAMNKLLTESGVILTGGTVEESPLAYKNIEKVIAAQHELVAIEGRFNPRIVRMNKK